jgi:hypothetical protein
MTGKCALQPDSQTSHRHADSHPEQPSNQNGGGVFVYRLRTGSGLIRRCVSGQRVIVSMPAAARNMACEPASGGYAGPAHLHRVFTAKLSPRSLWHAMGLLPVLAFH